ncbi:MAG: divalent-cation tolerance protein CutA [Myxococcota bacterium]
MADVDSRVVYVTAPTEEAPDLARILVDRRVAACVNLVAVRSIYRWQGQVQDDAETLMIIKTSVDRVDDLRSAITELHSYDVPEFLVLTVEAGHDPYEQWVNAQTRPDPRL